MRIAVLLTVVIFTVATFAQSIVTPVFVFKDGDATVNGYTGSEKEIAVDGGSQQIIGWITFQTEGVDFSESGSARLSLYVKAVSNPGTLQIRLLTAAITAPENSVRLADIPADETITTTIALGSTNVEKMIQLDLTAVVKTGAFYGVALTSDDGLVAAFDSKEGRLAPVILLTHDIESAASKWHSGANVPDVTLGKDGDYYLNTASGDVSVKSDGVWSVVTNIVGPTGAKGEQGDPGVAFDDTQTLADKTWSSSKINSELDSKVTVLAGKRLSTEDYTTAEKNKLAGISGVNTGDQDLSGLATKGEVSVLLDGKVDKVSGKKLSTKDYTAADSTKLANMAVDAVTNRGDMQYWDGTRWVRIPSGGKDLVLTQVGNDSMPVWRKRPMGSVMDIDGNIYQTVVIGNKEWTIVNLRTTHYNDGTEIPHVTDNTAWAGLSSGAYCYYNNTTDVAAQQKFGALYNWYAVGSGKLAPNGWRVSTRSDLTELNGYLVANGYNYDGTTVGNKIGKSMAEGIWTINAVDGAIGNDLSLNNKSGLSCLAGGCRVFNGSFGSKNNDGYWWCSTELQNTVNAYYFSLLSFANSLNISADNKRLGLSVRLVRDLD
jgi:uncharacterized protein (TIGR02145 family)